ncbi:hypothetical protein A2630_04190 [Candidatus Woesebacteria bacterium RIFCSPHIGHO2_01_FULL_44_10]|uniref:Uncharacterized protein n=1 Tax=Candidatus Woesebacteria bacterium RIFCSPLOWO2_01_FULL_44_14 TaxID=1802525 RepID=A0A1F8C3C3_9BACT|nr:MAG: hypothetical protein A2630_04190 [Candidatus Woesebacteria bacterium RIFCSPHIGHO2_01_FULL_44_10]OGM55457.1 MAG: hypothetical protein A3F62_00505 [Candidatus Woesebacteria bacterium RIFCSPHIGHO2_12_FULL_44_11]OGM70135.1 MAG: hypothetical protein A2975_03605 [Candidatus Woesebacteria bacterium RIFCSPLOWO2_01_FULL_44_14]
MGNLLLVLAPKRARFSREILDKLCDIFIGLGHLAVGSIILPFAFDRGDVRFVLLGAIAALVSWSVSIWLISKVK